MAGVAIPNSAGSHPESPVPRQSRSDRDRVDPTAVGHAVLPVAREDEVVGPQRPGGAHLGGLLAQQRRPQGQLALALERHGLGVEPPHHGHVGVEVAQLVASTSATRSQ